jgi:hypothetical protein
VSSLSDRDEELLRRMRDRGRAARAVSESMHLAIYLPLVIPVLAALAAGRSPDRLPQSRHVAARRRPACSRPARSAVLGLLALSALVRIPFVARRQHVRPRSASDTVAAGGDRGWRLLAAAAAAATRALWRWDRDRRGGPPGALLPAPGGS